MWVGLQQCISLLVASFLLHHSVDAITRTLTATSTSQTEQFPIYFIAESAGLSNSIIIDAPGHDDLLEVDVSSNPVISEEDCHNGGAIKLYSGGSPPVGYYMGSTCGGLSWTWFGSSNNKVVVSLNYTAIKDLKSVSVKFKIQEVSSSPDNCGAVVTVGEFPAYIRSPNYPNSVPDRYKSCTWVGRASSGKRIQFSIKFSSPETFDCTQTNVTFIDGQSLHFHRRFIHTWCGKEPSKFISWEQAAAVFAVGFDRMFLGFEVEMKAVSGPRCEYTIDGDTTREGVIANPSFPSSFPELQECRWVIKTSERKVIKIIGINSFMAGGKDCTVDSVEIYLNAQALTGVVDKWCNGNLLTFEYYTTVVLLIFKSNGVKTMNYIGFRAKYEISDVSSCSETLTATEQYQQLTSPNFPNMYRGNEKCIWTITTNDLMVVEFKVISSDLPYDCDDGMVSVYDGETEMESQILGTFCSSTTPEYRTKSNSMTVVFISTMTNTRERGFRAQYRTGLCGGKYNAGFHKSAVYSPGYPEHYLSNYNCYWNISNSWGAMGFRFTDLDIRCPDDYLMVYDGNPAYTHRADRQRSFKVCGSSPQSFYTDNLYLSINMQTTLSYGKGFNLTYQGFYKEFQGCGYYKFALYPNKTYQAYHSPGFPDHYFDRQRCRYTISAFYKIQVIIHIRGIYYTRSSCNGDYLSVHDGLHDTDPILQNKLCVSGNTTVTSTGRHMYVEFNSDEEKTGPGFIIYYRTVGERINTDTDTDEVVSTGLSATSTTLIITLSIVIPAVAVFICSMVIVCYVKCKGQDGARRSESYRERQWRLTMSRLDGDADAIRNRLEGYGASESETTNGRIPSAPSYTEPSSPTAPPPSYADISLLSPPTPPPPPSAPSETRADNSQPEAPPPSYMEAMEGNMAQDTQMFI